jgi:hypothetical protein
MDLIAEGIKQNLIRFENDGKYIVYLPQEKRRNYENPEEKVQAETFLKLVLIYKYPAKRIRQFVPVQMGSETKEADIIVYADDELKAPLIIGECKKPDVSEAEFVTATNQAVSYANPEGAKFVWVTSRIKNEYFEIPAKKPKARIPIPDIPQFGFDEVEKFKFAKGGGKSKNGQKLFDLEKVSEDELTRRFQQAHQALWGGGDPVANQPKRFAIESAVVSGKYPAQSLHTLVTVRKDIVDFIKPGERYVGLENIDGATGDLIETGEKESVSSALNFSPGQILFPKLRPYLNKTHRATISGLCSTEFYVFDVHGITAEFLAEFLRSQATVAVTSLLMTGNTLPRLQLADIEQLQIPIPPVPVQEKITVEIKKVRTAAHALRRRAAAELSAAKKEIEAMILGGTESSCP